MLMMMSSLTQKMLKLFIKQSTYQWSTKLDCWYIYSSLITSYRLDKKTSYMPFVIDNVSVIINQGTDYNFRPITTGYSILTFE